MKNEWNVNNSLIEYKLKEIKYIVRSEDIFDDIEQKLTFLNNQMKKRSACHMQII